MNWARDNDASTRPVLFHPPDRESTMGQTGLLPWFASLDKFARINPAAKTKKNVNKVLTGNVGVTSTHQTTSAKDRYPGSTHSSRSPSLCSEPYWQRKPQTTGAEASEARRQPFLATRRPALHIDQDETSLHPERSQFQAEMVKEC